MLLVTAVMLVVSGLMYQTPGSAQTPAPVPKFEVAAIKPCKAGDAPWGRPRARPQESEWQVSSQGRLSLCNTVAYFINSAYLIFANGRVNSSPRPPLEGGPAWVRSDRHNKAISRIGYGGTEPYRAEFMIR